MISTKNEIIAGAVVRIGFAVYPSRGVSCIGKAGQNDAAVSGDTFDQPCVPGLIWSDHERNPHVPRQVQRKAS